MSHSTKDINVYLYTTPPLSLTVFVSIYTSTFNPRPLSGRPSSTSISSPEGRPLRYLYLAQCDSEEIIRETLGIGEAGEMLFHPPKKGKVPVGWKYIIRPPLQATSTLGISIFKSVVLQMTSVISSQAASHSWKCIRSTLGRIPMHRTFRHGD